MSAHISLQQRIDDYLTERRRLGFQLRSHDTLLAGFARYVNAQSHQGALTSAIMVSWARQDLSRPTSPSAWANRLAKVRQFARYLKQFEPDTEIPEEAVFGSKSGRVTPHIFHEEEIVALLAAAYQLGPCGSLRPATYNTLFGLLASTGMRISEALHLHDSDVDLRHGVLSIRQTKFAKSRQLPVHPTTVEALENYRQKRAHYIPSTADMPFLISTCGQRLGQHLSKRQPYRIFHALRDDLGWINRGAHAAPRIHDLRHTFAVRCMIRWYRDGIDIDQMILALSTYMGHTKIEHTYWYLTAVPELIALAAKRYERFADFTEGENDE